MSNQIELQNEQGYAVDEERLKRAAVQMLSGAQDRSLTVVITTDEQVADLNRRFRGVDAPTDVLSFPSGDTSGYLGDLLIAYPYATAQATQLGHDVADTLDLLVVHGTLHLLGYDHDTPENRAAMWAVQEAALNALDISTAIVPSLEDVDAGEEE